MCNQGGHTIYTIYDILDMEPELKARAVFLQRIRNNPITDEEIRLKHELEMMESMTGPGPWENKTYKQCKDCYQSSDDLDSTHCCCYQGKNNLLAKIKSLFKNTNIKTNFQNLVYFEYKFWEHYGHEHALYSKPKSYGPNFIVIPACQYIPNIWGRINRYFFPNKMKKCIICTKCKDWNVSKNHVC